MCCRIPSAFLALTLFTGTVFAQANGRISGQVTDPTQAAIANASVTIENKDRGVKRQLITDGEGRYSAPDLLIGEYSVSVEASGFQKQTRAGLNLAVASALTVDVQLAVGTLGETVTVESTGGVVETNSSNGSYFSNKQMADLPINGRDYARFSLVTPGAIARSNFIADIGFNGMHTSHNQFSIDGVDASRIDQPYMANGFERGARLLTGSLDTMEEVKVQTSNYNAEYGRSAGSAVAIVSKSGTNNYHGSVFHFFRNDFLDARNFFNTKPNRMAPFRYNNFDGNLGGAIVKDKTFFFANYEGSRQRVGITGSGTVPSALLRQQVLSMSPALRTIIDQYPAGQSPTANALVDNYTTTASSKVREDTGSMRIDHNFNGNNRVYGRFNLNDTETFGPLFGVTPSALGVNDFQQVPVTTTNGIVNYSRIWTPRVIMELSSGIQRWGSQINSELPVPQVTVVGLTVVPGSRNFSRTNSTSTQAGGSLSIVRTGHTIKMGSTVWRAGVNPLSRDLVTITFTSLNDFINNSANQATITRGNPGTGRRQTHLGAYIQDTWQARPGLTIDFGLRYDVGTPNHGETERYRTFDTRINALGEIGAQWYAMNKKNFAPRFAIAWQPFKKTMIRTGYGIFYQQYPPGFGYSVALNTIPGNTTILRQQVPLLAYPVEPFASGGTVALPNVEGFNWDKPEMYAQQWNFTITQELPGSTSFQAAYVGNHGINLRRARNINFFDPSLGRRPISQFANVNVEFNDAQSIYHGLQTSLNRRFSKGFLTVFNYSWAKVIDNVQDYGLYGTQPQDNRCLGPCERGLGSGDVRHNVTYQVLYEMPFGKGKSFLKDGALSHVLGGWQISSLGLARSGIANQIGIAVNTFGNSNLANQRPNVVPGVDVFAQNQTINNWYNPAAFTMPAAGTFGNAARNIGRGPDFWQFDAAATKNTIIGEGLALQFRGEVFNVFNRPNFDFANGQFGTANFGRIFNTFGRTLGFGTSRQVQLSLRLRF